MRNTEETDFEETVKVPKRRLDPFGARQQAIGLAKRGTGARAGRHMKRLEYEAEDRGDHYEVTVRGVRDKAGPGKARGRSGRPRGPPDDVPGVGLGLDPGSGGTSGGGAARLDGQLDSLYSINELRRELSDQGVHYEQTDNKRQLIDRLVRRAPGRARRLVGRF